MEQDLTVGDELNTVAADELAPLAAAAEDIESGSAADEQDVKSDVSKYFEDENRIDYKSLELKEEMVALNRTAKVVKGGRRFSFAALMVIGDNDGHVGVGFGKAKEVPEAIAKATQDGKKGLIRVALKDKRTIPHTVIGEYGSARVLLKPASEGTGIIAGPAVRAVLSLAGVKDILTKSLGSDNQINVVRATLAGLAALQKPEQIARLRGMTVEEVYSVKKRNKSN